MGIARTVIHNMRCDDCPAQWCESNESVSPAEYGCSYGEKYEDEHGRQFADGSYGCLKRLKTIEKDLEADQKAMAECKEFYL